MKEYKIKLGVTCNNSCYFCAARTEKFHRDSEFIVEELLRARNRKFEAVVFTGLEPTIYPDILGLIAAARKAGMQKIGMHTNARRFSYPEYAIRAAELGLNEVHVLFLHHTTEGYAKISGALDGLEQSVAGTRNLLATGAVEVAASIPICGENYRSLPEIVKFIGLQGIRETEMFFPEGYLFENEEFDGAVFDTQLEKAGKIAAENGMKLECGRVSKYYRYVSEMEERSSPCFYPTFYVGRKKHPEMLEALLRPTFACNQICKFCWIDPSREKPGTKNISSEIAFIIKKKIPKLGFSGGEPTLDAALPQYIDMAKRGGVRQVELHTNAVRLTSAALCRELRDSGLDLAYCTLLASNAAVSDGITRTPGTFNKSVAGILNLITHGVKTVTHFVIMSDNYRLLPEFVRFVDETFSYGDSRLPITLSFVAPRDKKAMTDGIVPRFTDVMPYLEAAILECESRRIPFCAGEGLKGVPPCVIPFRDKYMKQFQPPPKNLAGSAFVKNTRCVSCTCNETCFGVRRHYAEYYGLDEIQPVHSNRRESEPARHTPPASKEPVNRN